MASIFANQSLSFLLHIYFADHGTTEMGRENELLILSSVEDKTVESLQKSKKTVIDIDKRCLFKDLRTVIPIQVVAELRPNELKKEGSRHKTRGPGVDFPEFEAEPLPRRKRSHSSKDDEPVAKIRKEVLEKFNRVQSELRTQEKLEGLLKVIQDYKSQLDQE